VSKISKIVLLFNSHHLTISPFVFMNKVDLITLGCSKNLVDSEQLIRQLEANGYQVEHDAEKPKGNIVIINTCGFIGDAKEASCVKRKNLPNFW
jgi:tRNA A37 methylthiotransferase MiaB